MFPVLLACLSGFAHATEGYYQHPTVSGDRVVFQAEGDLWLVELDGGKAERLTSHIEIESQPAFSPDGRHLAFLGHYDGSRQVYTMPLDGGAPRRLTFEEDPVTVEGWTNEGEVLFASQALASRAGARMLRAVDPDTRVVRDWPFLDANQGAEAADGRRAFVRYGPHVRGDHTRAYRGGLLAELWVHTPGEDEAQRWLADRGANLTHPRWVGDRLFFLSDESGVANVHSVDAEGRDPRAHTTYTDLPVRRLDADGDALVFQRGADVFHLEPNGKPARIAVTLRTDLDDTRERWLEDPKDFLEGMTLAPSGDRVAVTARGQVVLAGTEGARRVDLPLSSGERARQARISPDGEWVYAFMGIDGHDQLVRFAADGRDAREVLTEGPSSRRFALVVSPDGKRVAHTDALGQLWLTDVQSGDTTLLEKEPFGGESQFDITFSADAGLMAWATTSGSKTVLHLRELSSGRTEVVASERFPSSSPSFSTDGRFLYFLSARSYTPSPSGPWGDRNMGPAFDERQGVYALALSADARFPFLSPALGALPDEPEVEEEKPKKKRKKRAPSPSAVDWDGLTDRLYQVPVPHANFTDVVATEEVLLVGAREDGELSLYSIEIDPDASIETFAEGIRGFEVAGDRVLFRTRNGAFVVDVGTSAPSDLGDAGIDLDGWRLAVTPAQEWSGMFDDAWRMHRDFSFDPNMRGLDWDAVRARYEPMVSRVTHREELGDLLGEMIAELGVLHSQVRPGELPEDPEGGPEATLAATFRPVDGGLEVTGRLDGDPDLLDERSPLSRPEVDVREGDVLVSVNRRPVRSLVELSGALTGQAGRPVLLEVARDGVSRDVRVEPLPVRELRWRRYRHWEQGRRAHVDERSEQAVGYLHLYSMVGTDLGDFAREFFAVRDRPGLIIDVRGNNGGNIDAYVIGQLLKRAWAFWQMPHADEADTTNLQGSFRGHLVVLADGLTYSDGETFVAGVRALQLGPVVGGRTAGAGIWLSDRNALVDGGQARIGEFPQFDLEGNWLVEGVGVAPDIEVVNPPVASYRGQDAQLDRAIDVLLQRIEDEPIPVLRGKAIPPVPAAR